MNDFGDFLGLCGWAGEREADKAWKAIGDKFPTFEIMGATAPIGDDVTIRGWEIFRKIAGKDPNTIPQPTGDCVSVGARDVIELTQCVEILAGDAEEFHPVYSPYLYVTGRELIGRGRLRGGAGSMGSWQALAAEQHGVLRADYEHNGRPLPAYNKRNVDAWGDGRPAEGVSYKDFLEVGKAHPIKSAARINGLDQVRQALGNYHFCTIAASYGYNMKPTGGEKGFHRRGRPVNHQMSIWGIGRDWVAIKNQWGDVHGRLVDLETGEPWPPGFLRVPLEDFEGHLRAGAEVFAFSRFNGFPQQKFDFGSWA